MIAEIDLAGWTALGNTLFNIITAIGVVVSIVLGVRRGQKVQAGQAVQIKQGAKAIEQNERLEQKANQTLETVNGPLTHALTTAAIATTALADVTGKADDRERSDTAIRILDDHQAGQRDIKKTDLKPNGV